MIPETYVPEVGSKVVFTKEKLPRYVSHNTQYTVYAGEQPKDLYLILDNGQHFRFVALFSNSWKVVE